MRKTLFYALCALAFIPFAIFGAFGAVAYSIGKGLAKVYVWSHKELFASANEVRSVMDELRREWES